MFSWTVDSSLWVPFLMVTTQISALLRGNRDDPSSAGDDAREDSAPEEWEGDTQGFVDDVDTTCCRGFCGGWGDAAAVPEFS